MLGQNDERSFVWRRSSCLLGRTFDKAEILDLLKIVHRKSYLRPKFIARQIFGLQTKEELGRLTKGALSIWN